MSFSYGFALIRKLCPCVRIIHFRVSDVSLCFKRHHLGAIYLHENRPKPRNVRSRMGFKLSTSVTSEALCYCVSSRRKLIVPVWSRTCWPLFPRFLHFTFFSFADNEVPELSAAVVLLSGGYPEALCLTKKAVEEVLTYLKCGGYMLLAQQLVLISECRRVRTCYLLLFVLMVPKLSSSLDSAKLFA